MKFSWRLDDGTVLLGAQITHQFATQPSGITLVVTDVTGRSVEQWQPIDLYLAPAPVTGGAALSASLLPSSATAASFKSFFLISSRILPSRRVPTGYGKPRRGEAKVDLNLSRARAVTVTVIRIAGGKGTPVKAATVKLTKQVGPVTIRISARIGKAVLKPGKYKLTFTAVGPRVPAIEQHAVLVRVMRPGS